jgi:hypothetical protein
LGKRL